MHPAAEIAFNAQDGDIAVLEPIEPIEPSAEHRPNEPGAAAEAKCDPREVHQAIGALFVRAWAVRRRL